MVRPMKNATAFLLAIMVLTTLAGGDVRPAANLEGGIWPSTVPEGCPFPASGMLQGVRFRTA